MDRGLDRWWGQRLWLGSAVGWRHGWVMATVALCGLSLGALSLVLILVARASPPLERDKAAYAQAGTHQFRVWCTGASDLTLQTEAPSGEAARAVTWARLTAEGRTTCWPIWEGRQP